MFELLTYSVADLTAHIGALFEADDTLRDVWVQGEISNMVVASSGHWYFTLKDSQAQLRCALWRSHAARQGFTPENGDAVLAHGRVSVYAPRGEYQLYADAVQRAGLGDLYARLEQLKDKLRAEGLFDRPRQRVPAFPLRIGIVTSPEAAAFQDVQNVLRRRFPLAQVILSATPVQGSAAPAQIAAALARLNAHDACDVILLVRGGGSIEDLWAFNDEGVARAVANSAIPVISGVGHETDFTIVDFVADLRAPTPTAAAVAAVQARIEEHAQTLARVQTVRERVVQRIAQERRTLDRLAARLHRIHPQRRLDLQRQRLDERERRLHQAIQRILTRRRERSLAAVQRLEALNPLRVLGRGYSIVQRRDGVVVTTPEMVKDGDKLVVRAAGGEYQAIVRSGD